MQLLDVGLLTLFKVYLEKSTIIHLNLGPFLHEETKMQYSASSCAFSDFPLQSIDVMSKLEANEYLLKYANAYNLDKLVKLNTEVVEIRRHRNYEKTGKWTLKYKK